MPSTGDIPVSAAHIIVVMNHLEISPLIPLYTRLIEQVLELVMFSTSCTDSRDIYGIFYGPLASLGQISRFPISLREMGVCLYMAWSKCRYSFELPRYGYSRKRTYSKRHLAPWHCFFRSSNWGQRVEGFYFLPVELSVLCLAYI